MIEFDNHKKDREEMKIKASGRIPWGVNHGVFVLSEIVIVLNASTHGSRA